MTGTVLSPISPARVMRIGDRDFTPSRIESDEGHLVYLQCQRSGPSLFLIPGSFGDCLVFDQVVPNLPEDFNMVIGEIRGHGGSWPPPAKGSIEQFASDMIRIADAAFLGSFYVGGHSMGGMISLEVGRRWPERVRGVISIEGWTRSEATEAFKSVIVNTLSDEQMAKRQITRERVTKDWSEEQVREFARIWRRWDGYEFLATTEKPILEIWGDRGLPTPTLRELLIPERKNIEVVWMEGASHSLLLERPREVAAAISSFIQTRKGGGV